MLKWGLGLQKYGGYSLYPSIAAVSGGSGLSEEGERNVGPAATAAAATTACLPAAILRAGVVAASPVRLSRSLTAADAAGLDRRAKWRRCTVGVKGSHRF